MKAKRKMVTFSVRLSSDLIKAIEKVAEVINKDYLYSRNAAINVMLREWLENYLRKKSAEVSATIEQKKKNLLDRKAQKE